MKKFILGLGLLFISSFASAQGVNGSYLRITPTSLPTLCKLGDVRIDSISGNMNLCGSSNNWAVIASGTNVPILTVLGDTLYEDATPQAARLPGNTTTTNKFLTQTGTGTISAAPGWNIIAGSDLPNPSASTLGGIQSKTAVTHQFLTSISTSGVPAAAQPVCADLSNAVASCSTDATNASNISSGTLAVARGGTGLGSGTSGGVLAFTATGTIASSALLTQNALILGGGAGVAPAALGSLGTTTTVVHGNASGAPSFGAVSLTTDVSGTLPLGNGGTGQTTANAALNALLPSQTGNAGKFVTTDGSNTSWTSSSVTLFAPTRQIFKPEGTTITANLTSGNACIASPSNLNGINIGAGITDSTTAGNIADAASVVAIPGSCSAGQIQMSANAGGSGTGDTLVFGASKTITANVPSGSACLGSPSSLKGIAPGAYIYDVTVPSGRVAVNAVVVAVPGSCSAGQIQMSANGLAVGTGDTLIFSGGQYNRPSSSPLYLRVTGAGGGGGGCSTNGLPTYFGSQTLLFAAGGQGNGGAGGTASSTLLNSPILLTGGVGSDGFPLFASGAASGAIGGSNPFGGAGGGGPGGGGTGANGAPNTGSGGGSNGVGVGGTSSNGGSAGGYFSGVIASPSSTYLVFPGLGGTGGGCGNGGTGVVIVEENYQ